MTSLELGLQFMLYVVGKEGASHVLLGKVKRRRVVLRFDENGRVFSLAKARRKFVTSPHLTSPHLTSPHLTSPHLTSPHLTSPHLTSPHLTSPHLTSPHRSLANRQKTQAPHALFKEQDQSFSAHAHGQDGGVTPRGR